MSVTVANNRFIDFSLRAGFYQQIFSNISSLQKSGEQLVRAIELAHSYREIDTVKELGQFLSNHPIKEFRLIGKHYLGWCAYRKGEDAQSAFEIVLETSHTYKAKALWSLAAIASSKGNYEVELKYFTESLKYVTDIPTRIDLARGIAVVKAKEGFHKHALKDLENLIPFLHLAKPHTYYDCLNSLSVELGEAGRIEEALNVCRITLASPFAFAYPEWRETWQDLTLRGYKSRSVISFRQKKPENLLPLPERKSTDMPIQQGRARVLSYLDWKNKMVKVPNGENGDETNIDEMSDKDILFEIMNLTSEDDITREQLKEILDAVRKITSKKP